MAYNVFLSFAMEDKTLAEMFRGQAKNKRLDLEFRDYSIKEPFDSAWKTNCERIIRMCAATICLIGKATYKSDAVNWEIRKSAELGKGIMAVYLDNTNVSLPQALRELKVTPIPWQLDRIVNELNRVAK
ncbi:MAG: TIR domain-containing protein [Candidatus Binatia bacterium]